MRPHISVNCAQNAREALIAHAVQQAGPAVAFLNATPTQRFDEKDFEHALDDQLFTWLVRRALVHNELDNGPELVRTAIGRRQVDHTWKKGEQQWGIDLLNLKGPSE